MKKGLITTLIAVAISLTGATASFASAPVIGGIPDVYIGDNENNVGSDNNFFVFTNAFKFDDYASDADTTVSSLVWSFDEGDHSTSDTALQTANYFQINGKNGMHIGDAAIASNDGATTNAAHIAPPGANELRSGNVWASFRDIVFSPGAGTLPFPTPSPAGTVAAHAQGKLVYFYASDGTNVTKKAITVKTIDNTSDTLTGGASYTVVVDDILTVPITGATGNALGWDNFPMTGGLRTMTMTQDLVNTSLLANVSTSGAGDWATFGWITNGQNGTQALTYAGVGTGKIVRAKFFMYATGQTGAASNQVPSLRMRVANRFAITANLIVNSHAGSSTDALTADIQPNKTPATPSVYNVDVDPPDTPRLVSNAAGEAFLRAFELYDNGTQSNGSIAMTESQIGTYPASLVAAQGPTVSPVTASVGLIKDWLGGTSGGDFGNGSQTGSGVSLNNNWNGTVVKYNGLTPDTGGGQASVVSNASGVVLSTVAVETDRLGICAYDMFGGSDQYPQTTATRQNSARVEPGKQYTVMFHATSALNANTQPLIRFRAKTVAFDWTSTLEINGSGVGGNSALIVKEFAPGVGNAIPAADRIGGDTTGGWYKVMMASPMDPLVKASQPTLSAQDGPGVCTNVASNTVARRDIQLGVDIIDDFGGQGASEIGNVQLDRADRKSVV